MTRRPSGDAADTSERGAGTVLVLALVAVVLLLGTALAALGAAQQARATARSAADLGALAGATALRWGYDACSTSAAAVERNNAVLVSCEVRSGGVVDVVAARDVVGPVGPWSGAGRAESAARAGPRTAGS